MSGKQSKKSESLAKKRVLDRNPLSDALPLSLRETLWWVRPSRGTYLSCDQHPDGIGVSFVLNIQNIYFPTCIYKHGKGNFIGHIGGLEIYFLEKLSVKVKNTLNRICQTVCTEHIPKLLRFKQIFVASLHFNSKLCSIRLLNLLNLELIQFQSFILSLQIDKLHYVFMI